LQLKVFYKTFPETSKCPSCSKIGRLRRSRSRNFFESFVKLTRFFGLYKCRECGWRGFLSKYTFNYYSLITLAFYLILIASTAYIITKVLKKNFGG
jgi:hypothetical protein